MNHTQTPKDKLLITQHNLVQEIAALKDVSSALSDYKRKDWKSKWLTNHLKNKGIEAYYYGESYSEKLVIRYVIKEYRQSWNDQNESYYGTFDRTINLDVYFTNIETVSDLQTRLGEFIEARTKNLVGVTSAIEDVSGLQNMIEKRTAIIAENQKELDALDCHVRVAFSLTKN